MNEKIKSIEEFQMYLDLDLGVEGDLNLIALNILSKYTNDVIEGAEHDKIFLSQIDDLIEAGITSEDVARLSACGCCVEDDYLILFV